MNLNRNFAIAESTYVSVAEIHTEPVNDPIRQLSMSVTRENL
jgi:hypothetical protein